MRKRIAYGLLLLLIVAAAAYLCVEFLAPTPRPLPSVKLADGRILQIEAVTFGTNHVVGKASPTLDRFRPWLPDKLRTFLAPKFPRSEIQRSPPDLVIWVNAIDPSTSNHVDCQGIRVEFVNQNGDLFGEETSSWFGGNKFWRVGHIFTAFPRADRELRFRITPWRTNRASEVTFANPHVSASANWRGINLPAKQQVGMMEVLLKDLLARTNGGPRDYWETPAPFWKPSWELRRNSQEAAGWEKPDWIAEDPTGNRGQHLGVHAPVLRYNVKFYPRATNVESAPLIAPCPPAPVANLQSNLLWNLTAKRETNRLTIVGLFPPGVHHFIDSSYDPSPPAGARMTATMGGFPSGWVGQTRRVSPIKVEEWNAHYTPKPVIYVHCPDLPEERRIGVRFTDERGGMWAAEAQEGSSQGIRAFMLELPPGATIIKAEIVDLPSVEASFTVNVPSLSSTNGTQRDDVP